MRALVTGASGFVGRHLSAHLEEMGDKVLPFVHEGEVDVTDAESVHVALSVASPDVVYHLAAVSHIGDSWSAPAHVFRVNAEGTLNVLRACTAVGVSRVIVIGSADEYGAVREDELPIDEERPLQPRTPYGASKVAAEYLALQAFLGDGLGAIRVRAFNHTGPGQRASYLVPALARRIAAAQREGAAKIGVGSLEAVRDYSDVRDVVRAYRLLVERGSPGDVYNVCSGRGLSVGAVGERLLALADLDAELVVDPQLVRPIEVPALVGDRRKLAAVAGWEPETDLDTTLADVLAEARASAFGVANPE